MPIELVKLYRKYSYVIILVLVIAMVYRGKFNKLIKKVKKKYNFYVDDAIYRDPAYRQEIMDMTFYYIDKLNKHGVNYWIDFGTLLGVIRSGDMIMGDEDADLSMLSSELPKIHTLKEEIAREGKYVLKVNKCGSIIKLYSKTKPKKYIDLFIFTQNRKGDVTRLNSCHTVKDDAGMGTIFPLKYKYIKAWKRSVNMPNNPHKRLSDKYGKDYMTPKKSKGNYNFITRSKSVLNRCGTCNESIDLSYFKKSKLM